MIKIMFVTIIRAYSISHIFLFCNYKKVIYYVLIRHRSTILVKITRLIANFSGKTINFTIVITFP